MTKWIVIVIVVAALGGGGWYWFGRGTVAKDPEVKLAQAKVERGAISVSVASTGRIVSNLDVDIKCKASGEIIKLPFDVSDSVKKNDLLVELDPIDEQRVLKQAEVSLSSSQAKLASAKENLALSQRTLETDRMRADAALQYAQTHSTDCQAKADRMKELLSKKLASQEDFETAQTLAVSSTADLEGAKAKMEELKSQEQALELRRQDVKLAEAAVASDEISRDIAQDRLTDTKVLSPMDGVVSVRTVQTGMIISSGISNVGGGTTVLTLSDLSRIFVLASVDESDIGKVKEGLDCNITADAYRGKTFAGKVVRIATQGTNVSNVITFEVKVEVTSENKALLKPGMTANVQVVIDHRDDALLIPVDSVIRGKEGKKTVNVVAEGTAVQETPVKLGITDGVNYEVTEGLAAGQTISYRKGGADGRWSGGQGPRPPAMMMPPPGGR